MVTTSYPAVGTGGLTDAQWAVMYGRNDGIIEDYVGTACALTRTNGTDMCRVSAGKVSVNGYVLEIPDFEDLYCAPVLTGTVTYTIAVKYDPALNVAGVGGARSAQGPCRIIITDDPLDTTDGKAYLVLYRLVRVPSQLLASTALTDTRHWLGPVIEQPLLSGAELLPRGSVLFQSSTGEIKLRGLDPLGVLAWVSFASPPAIAFPAAAGLVTYDIAPTIYRFAGSMVGLRGGLKKSNGAIINTGSNVILGFLPVGYRPATVQRFIVYGSGAAAIGVHISASTGQVTMYDPIGATNITHLHLDNIQFRTN